MLAGAQDVMRIERALLVTKLGYAPVHCAPLVEVIESGHPVPDERSLAAGQRLLALMTTAPADVEWLFLISGGASSLIEVLQRDLTLVDLQRVNQWLLASGLSIEQMNAVRRRLSRIKGGQLCHYLNGRPARALLISDVPGDDPRIIGSGLLAAGSADCIADEKLPDWFNRLLVGLPEVPEQSDCVGVDTQIVARLDHALDAVIAQTSAQGLTVFRYPERLIGEAAEVGRDLALQLRNAAPGVHLWGGETTVSLPEHPGQGGRCQQLALAAAIALAGNERITLLAAGSDGSDGPGDIAGACIDGGTIARGQQEGLDALHALKRADAGTFLEACGDLLETGPTGTNVTDLVIALKRV
jgi:hydroxypyruvate reductase